MEIGCLGSSPKMKIINPDLPRFTFKVNLSFLYRACMRWITCICNLLSSCQYYSEYGEWVWPSRCWVMFSGITTCRPSSWCSN